MSERTEIDWVDRIRQGDDRAFEEVFRAYYDRLCTFAEAYVQSFAVAEELVDDLFLRLWERRQTLEVRGSLRSYLYRATRNRALNHIKHARLVDRVHSAVSPDESVPGMGQQQPAVDDQAIAGELRVALGAAIESLPDRCRTTHLLFWRDGLSYAEIADAMGTSRKTVENQLARALKLLRQRLLRWK